MVRQATDCQEIDTKHVSEKGLLARYVKSTWNLVTRKAIQFLKSKDVSKHLKNKTYIANKHMRRWPKSFVSSAIQVKTMSRYHCTPFELVLNLFPVAAIAISLCGLKWQKLILPQSESQKSPRSKCYSATVSPETGETHSWLFPFLVAVGSRWLVATSLLHLHISSFALCLSLLMRTLRMTFRVHRADPG